MSLRLGVLLLMTFCVIVSRSSAQKKFVITKVSKQDLEMKVYEKDTSASAVILFDIGHFRGIDATFSRKMRIKILTKAGLDWGNWVFNTPTKGEFDVTVYNLVDGKLETEKAGSKSIYQEKVVNKFQVYKVFAPKVQVGSVIDISYFYTGIPYEWRFQERIPIVYSELEIQPSTVVHFTKMQFGFEPITTVSKNEWHANNMPAFKTEPFMNNYNNYITKFQFQLAAIRQMEISASWQQVVNDLLEDMYFGDVMKQCAFLNAFANEMKTKPLTTEQKINAAFKYVQKNLKWNGFKSAFTSEDYRNNFLVDHDGSSGDINIILITLLNKMDITTYPIILSTRDNGVLTEFFPAINKLNYVVGYVQHGSVEMLLDATSEFTRPGILPERCLNGRGLLVKKDNVQWFELNKSYRAVQRQFATVAIDGEGKALAKITQNFEGYGYLKWADELKSDNFDPEVRRNKIRKVSPDVKVLSYTIDKHDTVGRASQESIEFDVSGQLLDLSGEYLFNPFVLFEYSDNPLKPETRKYPVDLSYPREFSSTVMVNLAKGYSVRDLPQSLKFSIPDGSASFTYLTSAGQNSVQLRVILKINKAVYTETEYKELREFFSQIVKKVNTPIQLSKT